MAKYAIEDSTLTAIGDAIRGKIGSTAPIRTDQMAEKIESIQHGIDTSDATAVAGDIAQGKTAYVNGKKVTGNIEILTEDVELDESNPTWNAEKAALRTSFGLIEGNRMILENNGKWIHTDIRGTKLGDAAAADVAEGKTFTSQNGLKLTGTKQEPVSVAQATPTISVSSAGLITASATQGAGLVAAGTKSATKQLTTQGAQTITPGTSNKTISSGRYLTGTQTIKGDANLIADNIKSGVSIFGVVGSMIAGGLPAGVSAVASGTVTPTENVSYLNVTHNMGVKPNFLFWAMEDDTSATVMTSAATVGATVVKSSKYTSTSTINYNVHNLISGYNASSQQAVTSTRVSNTSYMTATTARFTASTTYYLMAGKTYRWVCGVLDGIN